MTEYRQHRFTLPAGATDLLLVRHGESRALIPGEPFPRVDGHGDPELGEIGKGQAERVGERLKLLPIAAVYVTTLRRTVETARPLCDALALDAIVEPDLREVHLGDWEGGIYRIKAHEQDPLFLRMHEEGRWDVIPGAESNESLGRRTDRALTRIAERHRDRLVAVFTHGGIIGHILARATGSHPFAFAGADNGSVSRLILAGEQMILRGFNDISHLTVVT